jgi:hypothetical protein
MKKTFFILCISCLFVVTLNLLGLDSKVDYKVEEKEEIQKTLKFEDPSKPKEVVVDNIFGSITAEGYSGKEVQLLVHKTIKARTKEIIQRAKEEVELEITEDGNTIDLYVDGPFRCSNKGRRSRRWRNPGYEVHFDFELKVPHQTSLFLKTVTKGDIEVKNVEGEFQIKNVNGKIKMTEVAGAGEAHTVNGGVTVLFTKNPQTDCSFRTINGDIEISFREGLSADFRMKTFNGDAYSDFPVEYLPARPAVSKRHKGKFIYKSDRFVGVRVKQGGPEIKMDTLNGDLLIAKRKK